MSEYRDFEIIKPFVLSIIKAKITDNLIKKINEYVNQITLDKINWSSFLGSIIAKWIWETSNKKITKPQVISMMYMEVDY